MSIAKVQHYVPQFLLRNFGTGKKDQVFVFDKLTGKTFTPNAKNIASESRFYDFQVEDQAVSLEPALSKLETAAKPILESILKSDSLAGLSVEDRATLAVFLSVQLTRTRAFREQWNDFPRMLREHLGERGEDVAPGSQAAQLLEEFSENDLKAQVGTFMMNSMAPFAEHLLNKHWLLAATTKRDPFMLGDHPVAMQNMNDYSPMGNIGLAVPGIEIYLPLSPVRALALWCPSLVEMVQQGADRVRNLPPWLVAARVERPEELLRLDESIKAGTPIPYETSNVENFNSLQVAWSERYVFSFAATFDLARRMLTDRPGFKTGPRMRSG